MADDFPFKTLKEAWLDGWSAARIARAIGRGEHLVLGVLRDSGITTAQLHSRAYRYGRRVTPNVRRFRLYQRVRREIDLGERNMARIAERIGVPEEKAVAALRYHTQRQLKRRVV